MKILKNVEVPVEIDNDSAEENPYKPSRLQSFFGAVAVMLVFSLIAISAVFFGWIRSNGIDIRTLSFKDIKRLPKLAAGTENTEFSYSNSGRPFFEVYRNEIILAKKEGIRSYSRLGNEIWSYEGDFDNPVVKTEKDKLIVFDLEGNTLAAFSESKLIFELDPAILKGKILNADINAAGYVYVIQSDAYYRNSVMIFSPSGEWIFTKDFAEDYTLSADISDDGQRLLLCNLNTAGVNPETVLVFADMRGNIFSKIPQEDTLAVSVSFMDRGMAAIIADSKVVCLDAERREKWSYDYDGRKLNAASTGNGKNIALVLESNKNIFSSKRLELIILDLNGHEVGKTEIIDDLINIDMNSDSVIVNSGKTVYNYGTNAKLKIEKSYGKDVLDARFLQNGQVVVITTEKVVVE